MFVYARGIVNNGFFEEQMQFYCREFFFFLSTWHAASMNFLLVTEVKQRLIVYTNMKFQQRYKSSSKNSCQIRSIENTKLQACGK